jgi:DNA-directed RNA polymerase subunit RPC12/RpoP
MNRTAYLVLFGIAVLFLAGGLLFMCASIQQPSRLILAAVLLVFGAGLAYWSGMGMRRARQLDPENLSDQITALAERSGHAEVTLSQVVSELGVPDEDAQKALDLLADKGQAYREFRDDRWVYLFPGLKESRVIRRCSHCGREYSVKTPLYECPNCGGKVELVRV